MLHANISAVESTIVKDQTESSPLPSHARVRVIVLDSLTGLEIRVFGPADRFTNYKSISLRLVDGIILVTNSENQDSIAFNPYEGK